MKKQTLILTFSFLLITTTIFSQKQANNWYFGDNAGLSFSSDSIEVLSNTEMFAESGCSTISDDEGNLLFYSNGCKVWNRFNELMPNGDSIRGYSGSGQNTLIVSKPLDHNIYYLFTIDTSGFYYSIIDMSFENGLGDVKQKNINIIVEGNIYDKITATQHCNSIYTWIVIHIGSPAEFLSYLLTDSGIDFNNPVSSVIGSNIQADIGYLKVSPSGSKIVLPLNSSTTLFEVFDFDNNSGIISNPMRVLKSEEIYMYGCAFSSNDKVLYVSTGGEYYHLYQYDLTRDAENEFRNSAVLVGQGNIYAMQLAVDGKIYTACLNEPYVGIIHNPSSLGTMSIFENKAIFLNDGICKMGLPNFNQYYFFKPEISYLNACTNSNTQFNFEYKSNIDSVYWFLEDNNLIISNSYPFSTNYSYSEPGDHIVEMIYYHCGAGETIVKKIRINEPPYLELGNDTSIFSGDIVLLDGGMNMDEYLWNTGNTERFLEVNSTGLYIAEVTKHTCKGSDTININVVPVKVALPTAFSPNNDNLNDMFIPIICGPIENFRFAIFNRYGERVYYSTNYQDGWDGRYKGVKCPIETYYWELSFSATENVRPIAKQMSGYVSLIR